MVRKIQTTSFSRSFLLPLLIVISTTLIALFGLFWIMVSDQNASSSARETAQIKRGLSDRVEFVAANIRDYTRWNDAVDNLAAHYDADWANETIGPYLYNLQGYDINLVVNVDGSRVYGSEGDAETQKSPAALIGADYGTILSKLNSAEDPDQANLSGVIQVHGRPAVLSATAILPSPGTVYTAPYARRYMMIVQYIDADLLAKIGQSYEMQGVKLLERPSAETAYLPIQTLNGQNAGYVSWVATNPGSAMAARFLPIIILIALNAIGLSVYILMRARRATRDLAASETAARHMAHHDTLTSLPNRRALLSHGSLGKGNEGHLALVYLDLDGFKEVNDLFGHQAGDVLLREASDRLRAVVGRENLLVRIGGDEFAVLLTGNPSLDAATQLAQNIVDAMAKPFIANHIKMVVSASVGVAVGAQGDSAEELCRLADIAMYAAKSEGRNCWRVYSPEMSEGRELRKRLESELRDALDTNSVEVVFQPIVDAKTGTTKCLEALARWTSPTAGPVGPAIFVPIAEASGLIVKLGDYILRKACLEARDWDINIAVNLSPAQFWHQSLAVDILRVLQECDFPPERLELEITEGYLLSRPELAVQIIRDLRSKGIRIALDDFGTGFASIGYLRKFEIDKIKLDRSFVEMVDHDIDSALVAQAVVALSKSFKLPVTAEGVETEGQATLLTVAGCDRLQGWRYGYPTPGALLGQKDTHPDQEATVVELNNQNAA